MSDERRETASGAGTRDGGTAAGSAGAGEESRAAAARTTEEHVSNQTTGAIVSGVPGPSRGAPTAPTLDDAESPAQRGGDAPAGPKHGVPPAESWEPTKQDRK